jgi:foldase protein PrsA
VPPVLKQKTPILTATLVCAGLGVAACGSSGGAHTAKARAVTTTSAATQPAEVEPAVTASEIVIPRRAIPSAQAVAQVGAKGITWGAVVHQMSIENHGAPLPDPPSFSACVGRLKATEAGFASPAEATLQQNCRKQYEQLLREALTLTIHHQWILGEAREEGLSASPREVSEEFQHGKRTLFHSSAEYEANRKKSGKSVADVMFELKLGKLTQAIFKNLKKQEHQISAAEVAAYYKAHRRRFLLPAGLAVRIVRATTRSSAAIILQQLKDGKSFASAAHELSAIGQPIGAENGEVADLKPGVFEEKRLNDAIFSAKPNRIYGPLELIATHRTIAPETNSGFFIFEVTKATPASHIPLSRVKAKLELELSEAQRARIFPPFILAYRHRYKARTDCRPGFIVIYCRQSPVSKAQEDVDPYTL